MKNSVSATPLTTLERAILNLLAPDDPVERLIGWMTLAEVANHVDGNTALASIDHALVRLVHAGLLNRSDARPRQFAITRAGREAIA